MICLRSAGKWILRTLSLSELPLSLMVNWAVRLTKAGVAKRFTRSADALIDIGPMSMRHGPDSRGDNLFTLVDDDMPALQ